jgi:hypothetical protein
MYSQGIMSSEQARNALDCVLLKDRNLALAPRQVPEINSQACLWVSPITYNHIQCWLSNHRLILPISCLDTPKSGSGPTYFTTEQSLASCFVGLQILLRTFCLRDSQKIAGRDLVDSWSCRYFPIVIKQSIGTKKGIIFYELWQEWRGPVSLKMVMCNTWRRLVWKTSCHKTIRLGQNKDVHRHCQVE